MDHEEVSKLKQAAVQADVLVKALIQEIYKCTDWESFHDLHQNVAKHISSQKKAVSELENLTRVARKSPELDVLLIELEGFRAQSEANYLSLKKASSFSRHAIENQDQSELFRRSAKSEEEESMRKRRMDKESLSKKASSLTEDLLSISQLMSSQVAVSEQSLNSLISSSAVVTETQEEFKMMGSLLGQSRKLLAKFGRREVTDRALIVFALAFYFASCTYVVLKRLF